MNSKKLIVTKLLPKKLSIKTKDQFTILNEDK